MSHNQTTALLCILAGLIATITAYTAFVAGFNRYADTLSDYSQTAAVQPANGSNSTLTVTPAVQQAIKLTSCKY